MTRLALIIVSLGALVDPAMLHSAEPAGSEKSAAKNGETSRAKREQQLADQLTGSVFEGHFTNSAQPEGKLTAERYEIAKAAKLQGEHWLLQARIKYADHDLLLPLTLPVRWAGDTPVISLDRLAIPGLGTFSARVVIHGDQYAGTWSAGDHGGHLFGRIVKAAKEEKDKPKESPDVEKKIDAQGRP